MSDEQELITRCPSCSTSFRVTSEQLQSAGGAVRCGACLRIFQAEEYLAFESTVYESAGDQPNAEDLKESEHEVEISREEEDEENLVDESERLVLAPETLVREEFDEKGAHKVDSLEEDAPKESTHKENGHKEGFQQEQVETEQLDTEQFEKEETETEAEAEAVVSGTLSEDVTPEKYSAEEILNKYWQDWEDYLLPLSLSTSTDGSSDVSRETHWSPEFVVEHGHPDTGQSEAQSEGISEGDSDDSAAEAREPELAERISNLELGDEPEDFMGEVEREKRPHPLWYAATILLLISAALQYLWFNKDVCSQQAEYRPYYQIVCRVIGCELPEYKNAQELFAKNLLIRSHPQFESALIVDAILHNSAGYRQEFPDLRILFRNIENTPVSARVFSPADYLAGELRGLRYIPANTEVRFSIEISDPGKNALGYSLEVLHRG